MADIGVRRCLPSLAPKSHLILPAHWCLCLFASDTTATDMLSSWLFDIVKLEQGWCKETELKASCWYEDESEMRLFNTCHLLHGDENFHWKCSESFERGQDRTFTEALRREREIQRQLESAEALP